MEDNGKVRFFLADALDLADSFHDFLVAQVAPHAIDGVGGEDDDAAVGKAFQYHLDVAWVGVFFVKFDKHRFEFDRKSTKNN